MTEAIIDFFINKGIKTLATSQPENMEMLADPQLDFHSYFERYRNWRLKDGSLWKGLQKREDCVGEVVAQVAPLAFIESGPETYSYAKSPSVEINTSIKPLVQWVDDWHIPTDAWPHFLSMNSIAEAKLLGNSIYLESEKYLGDDPVLKVRAVELGRTNWEIGRKTQSTIPKGDYIIKFGFVTRVLEYDLGYQLVKAPDLYLPEESAFVDIVLHLSAAKKSGSNRKKKSDSENSLEDVNLER